MLSETRFHYLEQDEEINVGERAVVNLGKWIPDSLAILESDADNGKRPRSDRWKFGESQTTSRVLCCISWFVALEDKQPYDLLQYGSVAKETASVALRTSSITK